MTIDTAYIWFQIVQTLVMGAVMVLVLSMRAGRWGGQKLADMQVISDKVTRFEARLDAAGHRMSDLTDVIQKLPETLRGTFVPKDGELVGRILSEHEHTRQQVTELWLHVNSIRGGGSESRAR